MWLPALGSLQTVVLLTPGKWAARWICFNGLPAGVLIDVRFLPAQAVASGGAPCSESLGE